MTVDDNSRAATFLRTLAEVEQADAVGDSREVGRLLAGVDRVEVRRLADALDFQAAVRSLYMGPVRRASTTPRKAW